MERYVVSAQRSGLNWFRFCTEHFYGLRTPGQTSIISEAAQPNAAFIRSHDALNASRRSRRSAGGAWTRIDPAATSGDLLLLILRDPLETYVRMAERRLERFLSFVGNIRFYSRAAATKRVAYYEDLVADPSAMAAAMRFLDLKPGPGHAVPDAQAVAAEWERLGEASRANYDAKQSGTGGAQTRAAPLNFAFHQAGLDPKEAAQVWRYLQVKLRHEELALLDRYRPAGGLPPIRLGDRLRFAV